MVWVRVRIWDRVRVTVRVIVTVRVRVRKKLGKEGICLHSKMLLLKCGAISELYMILRVYFGRKCFSLFITPYLCSR